IFPGKKNGGARRYIMEEKIEREDIIDILLNEENKDPIILSDNSGRKIAFEQIAVIPYDEKLYCVLKPIDHIENVSDDEAIVFYVEERDGEEPVLMVETDELKALDVFEEYYSLLDEEQAKGKR
ncbi:MAG: DUF1292 domain-containing protein, partial [Candidatus Coproplasma sp.]